MQKLNQVNIRLESAPGFLTVTATWLGLEGDEDEVYNKYDIIVDDAYREIKYCFLRQLPAVRGNKHTRLSVHELAMAFWEMLESAILVDVGSSMNHDARLLERLGWLDIDRNNIPEIMAELKAKYNL